MKTEDLIASLASDAGPVDAKETDRGFLARLAGGMLASVALVLVVAGPRPDLAEATALPMFWVKLLFPASLAALALVAFRRLCYPGMRLGLVLVGTAMPVAVMWAIAVASLMASPAEERLPLVMGETWLACVASITAYSVPAFALAFWAARALAPTRLALAGGAAGLFAGAAAATGYALYCPEIEAPFLAVWYLLGMLVPAGAGAVLGRRWLRW